MHHRCLRTSWWARSQKIQTSQQHLHYCLEVQWHRWSKIQSLSNSTLIYKICRKNAIIWEYRTKDYWKQWKNKSTTRSKSQKRLHRSNRSYSSWNKRTKSRIKWKVSQLNCKPKEKRVQLCNWRTQKCTYNWGNFSKS